MSTLIAVFIIFALAFFLMSLGVILSNKCIQGSCGSSDSLAKIMGTSACDSCGKKEICSKMET